LAASRVCDIPQLNHPRPLLFASSTVRSKSTGTVSTFDLIHTRWTMHSVLKNYSPRSPVYGGRLDLWLLQSAVSHAQRLLFHCAMLAGPGLCGWQWPPSPPLVTVWIAPDDSGWPLHWRVLLHVCPFELSSFSVAGGIGLPTIWCAIGLSQQPLNFFGILIERRLDKIRYLFHTLIDHYNYRVNENFYYQCGGNARLSAALSMS
jgi:hypothetical protein